jgi:hypothetical protein
LLYKTACLFHVVCPQAKEVEKQLRTLSRSFHKYANVLLICESDPTVAWYRTEVLAMPRRSPYEISLSPAEECELRRRAAKYTLPYFQVVRAKMVLLAAQGLSNDEIAASLDTRREVVSLWRKRFFEKRLAGLEERPRPGRPRTFSP